MHGFNAIESNPEENYLQNLIQTTKHTRQDRQHSYRDRHIH